MIKSITYKFAVATMLGGALALAAPQAASAAHVVVSPCDASLVDGATSCVGYYEGNLLSNSPTNITLQTAAIADLNADYTFDGNFNGTTKIETLTGGNMLDFGTMLFGETVIGIHFGNVAGPAGNVTAFYLFDFGTDGVSSIRLNNTMGFSNAVLYNTSVGAVPEPATWALMILAFGAIGFGMRRRRSQHAYTTTVRYA